MDNNNTTYEGLKGRVIGIVFGTFCSAIGIGMFVYIGVLNDLFPRGAERLILDFAPWLGDRGGDLSMTGLLIISGFCVVLSLIGLWKLGGAFFKSDYSITFT